MRVLVTGDSGYIGSVLTSMLLRAGHEVVGVDTEYFGDPSLSELGQHTRKDVRDIEEGDLHSVNAIVHLAALSNDPMGEIDPTLTYDINYYATVRLAVLAKSVGVERFIFASSCSVYGDLEGELVETSPLNPLTAYARSKTNSEEALLKMTAPSFHPIILRNGTAYGMSPNMRLDLVVNTFVADAIVKKEITMFGGGKHSRPIVHVGDIGRAIVAVLGAPKRAISGQIFNVLPVGENYSVKDIAEAVKIQTGCEIKLQDVPSSDIRSYRVNASKIRSLVPTFRPIGNLYSGIKGLCFGLRDIDKEKIEHYNYNRLKKLRYLIDSKQLDKELKWT